MAKIVISELDIDVNALIKSTAEVKNAIDVIKNQQKELTKSGQTASNQFVQNAADLKTLNSAYNSNLKAIADSTQATADQANRTALLDLALQNEAVSIKEAREQNVLLNKLRNEANATTAEGQAEITALNKKLDENNEFIKENADAYLKQKINIGNYSESIKDAVANIDPLNGGMSGFIQRSQDAGGAGNLLKTSFSGISQGIMGATKASLAFIATPIGLVITALAVVLGSLYAVFSKLDPVMDKIAQLTAGLSGAFDKATTIIANFFTGITSVGDAMNKIGNFFLHPIDAIKGFSAEVTKAGVTMAKLKEQEQGLGDLKDIYEVRAKKIQSEIELDKIKLKNKHLTADQEQDIEKRVNDNYEKLSGMRNEISKKDNDNTIAYAIETQVGLKKISKETLENEIKNGELKYANFLLNEGRITTEAYNKLKESANAKIDLQNKAIEDEARTQDKIDKADEKRQAAREKAQADAQKRAEEAEARRQKILDDAVAKSNAELQLFLSQQGIKAKSLEDQLSLAETVYQKQLEINQKEFDASKKTATDKLNFQIANNEASNALIQTQSDLVVANAQTELNNYIALNQSKIDANKALTDEIVAEEKTRNANILQEKIDFANLQLAQGVTNQKATDEAIAIAKEEARLKGVELDTQLAEQKKEADLINRENQLAIDEGNWNLELKTKLARLKIEQDAELANAEKTGSDKDLINQKYTQAENKMRQMVEASKLSAVAEGFSRAKSLFAEHTVAYKAMAIAEATINTYKAATAALSTQPAYLGIALAAVDIAAGLANVAKIAGVKLKDGAIDIDGPGTTTSDSIPAQLSRGESVINAKSTAKYKDILSLINQDTGGNAFSSFSDIQNNRQAVPTFANGGSVITQGVQPQQINTTELAFVTADLIRQMPPPQVAVTDIHRESNSYVEVVDGANF